MPGRRRWFLLAVALQLLILLAMAGRSQYTLVAGVPVLLKPEPIDPFDPFRGDYVRLYFAVNRVPVAPASQFRPGELIWVILERPADDKYWRAGAASRERPTGGAGQVAVRGRVQWMLEDELQVEYGFEQFYVPEGQGWDLERHPERLEVEVAVDRFGRGAIRRLLWDGEPVEWR